MRIELTNPSAFHALRVFTQARVSNPYVAGLAPRQVKIETRADWETLGSRLVDVPSKGTVRDADGTIRSVTRNVPTQFFRTEGYGDLAGFVTKKMEEQLRLAQQAAGAVTAMRGQKVLDKWGDMHPLQHVPPGAKNVVLPLAEDKRLVIECPDDEVALQIANESNTRTLRLRQRDTKTGETTQIAYIAPVREYPQAALVICSGSKAAVVELTPT